jgi:predicted PurR-regulated permease PerM
MTSTQRLRFWVAGALVFLLLLWLLRGMLLPFVAGMAIAYFLDPLACRLERLGLSRTIATVLITAVFFAVIGVLLFLLIPLIEQQVVTFAQRLPGYVDSLNDRVQPLLQQVQRRLSPRDIEKLRSSVGEYAGTVAGWALGFVRGVLTGGIAVVSILSLLFITPVVTFYLLRDWEKMLATVDSWLPRGGVDLIHTEFREINRTLSGFVRGQATVCIVLAIYYGIGLTSVGLDLGLVIGIGTGLAAFVPYVGMITGLVISLGLALAQGSGWSLVGMVAVVFLFGNVLEGNFLTPKLVGDRVGLHPVWIIFSLLAGGALFGFLGILLAVPVAAVLGVFVRLGLTHYLASPLYSGEGQGQVAVRHDETVGAP